MCMNIKRTLFKYLSQFIFPIIPKTSMMSDTISIYSYSLQSKIKIIKIKIKSTSYCSVIFIIS